MAPPPLSEVPETSPGGNWRAGAKKAETGDRQAVTPMTPMTMLHPAGCMRICAEISNLVIASAITEPAQFVYACFKIRISENSIIIKVKTYKLYMRRNLKMLLPSLLI